MRIYPVYPSDKSFSYDNPIDSLSQLKTFDLSNSTSISFALSLHSKGYSIIIGCQMQSDYGKLYVIYCHTKHGSAAIQPA